MVDKLSTKNGKIISLESLYKYGISEIPLFKDLSISRHIYFKQFEIRAVFEILHTISKSE